MSRKILANLITLFLCDECESNGREHRLDYEKFKETIWHYQIQTLRLWSIFVYANYQAI